MMQERYEQQLRKQEALLNRKNEKTDFYNGIYDRWKYPVLTREHVPLYWRYDLNPETNPYFMERLGINAVFNAVLDFFDFMTNSVMMPLAALATCILILRVVGIDGMVKEIEQSSPFRRKKLYRVFIKYFAPICLIIILLSSIANVLGIISM